MRVMVIVYPSNRKDYEAGLPPNPEMMERMGGFNQELEKAGILIHADGLSPSTQGVRLHFSSEETPEEAYGPFDMDSHLICGFWIWEVSSRQEALQWARRAPMEPGDMLEVRAFYGCGESIEQGCGTPQ